MDQHQRLAGGEMTPLPSQEILQAILDYDEGTGKLTWKTRDASMFPDGPRGATWAANKWNSCFAGKEAFTATNNSGYHHGTLQMKSYLAHRIIWKLIHGFDPIDIDHIDGDRVNNRIENLRSVTRGENLKNVRLRGHSVTGVPGVSLQPDGKYAARIGTGKGSFKHLGRFGKLDEAIASRKAAEILYGYHPNHGRLSA